MKKIIRRILIIRPAVLLQILWLILVFNILDAWAPVITVLLSFLSLIFVIYIITKQDESTYKILWLLLICTFPLLGTFIYLIFGSKRTTDPLKKALDKTGPLPMAESDREATEKIKADDPRLSRTFSSLSRDTGYPVQKNYGAKYYRIGEDLYRDLIPRLKSAEKFIYLEYFIIEKGVMWDTILDILKEKRRQGLDVRVMYDDIGSLNTFSGKEAEELRKAGIKCTTFNPLLLIKGTLNCRDHRKMTIIDGKVVFTGGINLADEYINQKVKHGHWKDIGFKIEGPAVASFVRMYAEFQNAFSKDRVPEENLKPLPPADSKEDGAILSWYDSPPYDRPCSNKLYIDLLSQAMDYAWFFTPYLMPGDALMNAFISAAKRGVDVRIIMPGVPDKKIIFRISRSFYAPLLEAGVKIYEYTPGFVHAKRRVFDDRVCTVGTVNLDYRSLFLHFENNSLFYGRDMIKEVKKDILNTQEMCVGKIPEGKRNFFIWMLDGILRTFSPLF